MTRIKEKPDLKFRHELKFAVSCQEDSELSFRLRKLFKHDANADSHGSYRVSSLYFDSPYDKALREKLDGVNQREKFRIRYYGEDTGFLRLEKKMKLNGLCAKQSVKLTFTQAEQILKGNVEFLLMSEEPLFIEFYSKMKGQLLKPKTIVCYDREAFLYEPGNVRITLDRNVRTSLCCMDFLKPDRLHMGVADSMSVLEVKYDNFLPQLVQMAVQTVNQRATAYSKYALCRKYD